MKNHEKDELIKSIKSLNNDVERANLLVANDRCLIEAMSFGVYDDDNGGGCEPDSCCEPEC